MVWLLDLTHLKPSCGGRLPADLSQTLFLGHPSWPQFDPGHGEQRYSRKLSSPAAPLKLEILQLDPANQLLSMGNFFHACPAYTDSQKPYRGKSGIMLLIYIQMSKGREMTHSKVQRVNE